jgi:hypothetical protein
VGQASATDNRSIIKAGTPRRIRRPAGYLLIFCAAAARNGLYDLDLFAGTGVLDKVPDVDDAIGAGVGMILVVICSRWVRGLRGRLIHVNSSDLLAAPPGD